MIDRQNEIFSLFWVACSESYAAARLWEQTLLGEGGSQHPSWVDMALYSSREAQTLSAQALAEKSMKNLESSPSLWDLIEISEFCSSEMGKITLILENRKYLNNLMPGRNKTLTWSSAVGDCK